MTVTLEIPDAIAAELSADGKDLSRAALEALALDAYRTEKIGTEEVRRMLGYETRFEVHDLLANHRVNWQYGAEDLAHDIMMFDKLHSDAA
jgi:hypothetical protein